MIRKQVLLATLVLAASVLAGCHTISGAGQDIQSAGSAITNAADKK
jgi:predicted small secreted protein